MLFKKLGLAICLAGMVLTGCRLEDEHSWDVDLVTPIAEGELSIGDLIKSAPTDTSGGFLRLVEVVPLHEVGIGELIQIPDTTVPPKSVSLKTLSIGERTMKRNITLGEIAKNAGPV